jgi:hypothetical protein
MASSRKVRNANKRYAKINEDWQDKDDTNVNKSKVRVSLSKNHFFFFLYSISPYFHYSEMNIIDFFRVYMIVLYYVDCQVSN